MTRKSYAQLQKDLLECQQVIADLKTDPAYHVTVRAAIPFEMRHLTGPARYVVFLDIDDCHGANQRYGYDTVNGKIRRAIHVRHKDVLLTARWFSGDELIVLLQGDPAGFIERLETALKNEGLSATMCAVEYTGDLEYDVKIAAAIVSGKKMECAR